MQKRNNKIVAIFTPFPAIIGGGERYIFSIAETYSLKGFKVKILSPYRYNIRKFSKAFNLKLKNCSYQKTNSKDFFLPNIRKEYDYFFCLSNHINPPVYGNGNHNALIIQFPFPHPSKKLGDKIQKLSLIPKLKSYDKIICYSEYSKKQIKKVLPKNIKISIDIIYPPIDIKRFKQKNKKNIVLAVGRFFVGDHNKQHNILIETFKDLYTSEVLKDWQLHIAGYLSNDSESKIYFNTLKEVSENYPIFMHKNISDKKLTELYNSARIFWHAAGYKNNEKATPEKSEHFGIAVIEAMAAGAVPFVAKAGAMPELIKNRKNGFLWSSTITLKMQVKSFIDGNFKEKSLIKNIVNTIQKYDLLEFQMKVLKLYKTLI